MWPLCIPDGASIEREFNLVHAEWQFPASYNVAPTQSVPLFALLTAHGMERSYVGPYPFFARECRRSTAPSMPH